MKRLLPLFIFFSIIVLLNWYVLSAILTINSHPYIAPAFWSFILLLTVGVFYAVSRIRRDGTNLFFVIVTHVALALVVSEIFMSALLLAGDLFGLIIRQPRSVYWIEACFTLMLISILLFVYGIIFGKYRYRVIRHTLYFENLPPNFDGFRIAQISDVHAGSFTKPNAVQRGIELINAQNADAFVFTGDLVNNKAEEIKPWISYFSQIKAPHGQYSILGNHDYGDYVSWSNPVEKAANLNQLKTYHQELGFRLLLDEHINIERDGQKIILAGVENWGLGFGERGDLQKAMEGVEHGQFTILLSHDPTHWEAQVKDFKPAIPLTLSGHTHGMQFGIEAFGIKWSPVKYRYRHWAGLKEENGRVLNINRGFGFIGFSGRIGIWPEITILELKRSK